MFSSANGDLGTDGKRIESIMAGEQSDDNTRLNVHVMNALHVPPASGPPTGAVQPIVDNFISHDHPNVPISHGEQRHIGMHTYPDDALVLITSQDPYQRQADILTSIWPHTTKAASAVAPHFCKVFEAILATAQPNHKVARIQVTSDLNLDAWDEALEGYHDKVICKYLRYGWPLGYHKKTPPESTDQNHPSANQHLAQVQEFINKEMSFNAILGPFEEPPFAPWFRSSPVVTRPKKDSIERRVIVDLSYPEGQGVNDGIDICDYFGTNITYTLPSLGDLIQRLQDLGPNALVWKADLARAYRQMRIDPLDTPLLRIKVAGRYYVDLCLPFGCRTSSAACQRLSNAVIYLHRKEGYFALAYLDDYGGCEADLTSASNSYESFLQLASHLGLQLAEHKCVPPCTDIDWLGYRVDTVQMSITIPTAKLEQAVAECDRWANRSVASKKMIQSLAGRLLYLTNCVRHARKFLVRILATLRGIPDGGWVTISPDFKLDLAWFSNYAKSANGVYYYTPTRPEVEIQCDSSLLGGGGLAGKYCYEWKYPQTHRQRFKNIHQLEAVNLLVAYSTLAHLVAEPGCLIVISTDNISSSIALQTGRTKDIVFGNCARELWLLAAINNHIIEIRHKPGTLIPMADALSRKSHDPTKAAYVQQTIKDRALVMVAPRLNGYKFFSEYI